MRRYIKSDRHDVINYSKYNHKIKTGRDFHNWMQDYAADVMDVFEELRPDWELHYIQNGSFNFYLNVFYVYVNTDSDTTMVEISDEDLLKFDNYADIIKFTVNTILDEVEGSLKRYIKSDGYNVIDVPETVTRRGIDEIAAEAGVSEDEAASWITDRPADEIKWVYEPVDDNNPYLGIAFYDGSYTVVGLRKCYDNLEYDEMIEMLQ